MFTCYAPKKSDGLTTPIVAIPRKAFVSWLTQQSERHQNWINQQRFTAKPNSFGWLPTQDGTGVERVLLGVENSADFLPWGGLPLNLPQGTYHIFHEMNEEDATNAALAWGLGAYAFTRYKPANKTPAQLVIPADCLQRITPLITAIYFIRDLINTPAEDMGPLQIADATKTMAAQFNATVQETIGDALLTENYPAIHAVGRASTRPPRLIDLQWGQATHPKVTLVGKGVCFDSGGLDLKTTSGMALMKKDMAGAAHALGLAYLIMSHALPIRLRVLIPAVDNVIAGNAYRPGDIIVTRQGLSVEVNNTDAEGRLIVADALSTAAAEQPDLLLDFTTLTGAARVAVGPDITALFCNDRTLAQGLLKHAEHTQDPIVELPLYLPYRKYLESKIADISNTATIPYGGAMTAALFLQEFVPETVNWAHFDLMAWNLTTQPSRPEGGEAMAIRAVWSYLRERFAAKEV